MLFRYRDYAKRYNAWVRVFEYEYYRLSSITATDAVEYSFKPDGEALVFALRGSVNVNGVELQPFDMAYVPKGLEAKVIARPGTVAYIAESWADRQLQFYVKRRSDVKPVLSGVKPYERNVYTLIGEKDPADSFLAGYTEGAQGNWTSYPPHRHDGKPEAYIFYNIDPGLAVQLVLSEDGEEAYVVHDFDVVLITKGYHPNLASTIGSVNYAWVIAAPRGQRTLAVEFHPMYRHLPLGQTHLTIR